MFCERDIWVIENISHFFFLSFDFRSFEENEGERRIDIYICVSPLYGLKLRGKGKNEFQKERKKERKK